MVNAPNFAYVGYSTMVCFLHAGTYDLKIMDERIDPGWFYGQNIFTLYLFTFYLFIVG